MIITDVKYITIVMPFKISHTKKYVKIELKKNTQTFKMRNKIENIKSNFVKFLTKSNRYLLIKNINANNKGRIISYGSTVM